nr:hypothetical protein [Tanacetum cinerariifolium]
MNQVLNENERLLEQVGNKDIVNIVVYSSVDNAYVNVHECEKCLKLETELLNKKDFIEKDTYDKLIMSITKEQQQALDDALVPREQHLRIGNCNYRLSTTFKPKEPTFQVALDVLSLTPFYQAFLISVNVPAIYMH